MKNLLIALFAVISLSATAQYTIPRTGTGANNDNTFRALTFKFASVADATGSDTLKLNLNAYNTHLSFPALSDSVIVKFTGVANSYVGDQAKFTLIGTATGAKIRFTGSNYVASSATLAVSTGKKAVIIFMFDGVSWVEVSRAAY